VTDDNWYRIEENDGVVTVTFQPSRIRFWPPSILHDSPLRTDCWHDKSVHLTGQGSTWIYAHSAWLAVHHGAKSLSVGNLHNPAEPIPVWPVESKDVCSHVEFQDLAENPDFRVCRLNPLTDQIPLIGQGWQDILSSLLKGMTDIAKEVCITDQAPVAIYAAAGAAAASQKLYTTILTPRTGGRVVISGPTSGTLETASSRLITRIGANPDERGVVLGIIGDPNSGKSQLCRLLDLALDSTEANHWVLDCDAASPTQPWYLDLLHAEEFHRARELREDSKRTWSDQMEQRVRDNLQDARWILRYVIADLPGGLHTPATKCRIPKGREVIMEEVDYFLILRREDQPEAARGWREELAGHGLAHRVRGELVSYEPDCPPGGSLEIAADGSIHGRLCGLDRSRANSEFEEIAGEMARILQEALPRWMSLS
jgi:hypothetical protein